MNERNLADQLLVAGCLTGEESAWQLLVGQHHHRLCNSIAALLPRPLARAEVVEEIAQRVWYSLLERDRQRLRAYDPSQACLSTYLATLARWEIEDLCRARHQEAPVARRCDRLLAQVAVPFCPLEAMIDDLLSCLTPREREFAQGNLLNVPAASAAPRFSASNARKLKQRVLQKCRASRDRR